MASQPLWLMLIVLLCTIFSTQVHGQEQFMVGGNEVPLGKYPWQASMQLRIGNAHMCGAIIMNSRWAITPAHCVGLLPSFVQLTVGLHSLTKANLGKPTTHYIDKFIPHYGFKQNSTGYSFDIALIHTETVIKENHFTQFAKLPEQPVLVNTQCWVSGWGATHDRSTEKIWVGPTDIEDAIYMDNVQTRDNTDFIPDPGNPIPADGILTTVELYAREAGDVDLKVYRATNKYQYDLIHTYDDIDPTSAGKHTFNTSLEVKKGDIIGVWDPRSAPRMPYRLRQDCQHPTLVYTTGSGNSYIFSPPFIHPCRTYPFRVGVKVSSSESELSDVLQHALVTVTGTTGEQIVAEGVGNVPCLGDDGGALNFHYGEDIQVAGLYSYSRGSCRPQDPAAVYTDTFFHREWILENIANL